MEIVAPVVDLGDDHFVDVGGLHGGGCLERLSSAFAGWL